MKLLKEVKNLLFDFIKPCGIYDEVDALILDEPTSGLDDKNNIKKEYKVRNYIFLKENNENMVKEIY